jgi:steroid 5-alpha reductase family enzyme
MTVLLMRVSGVTLLERKLRETRPGYRRYAEVTSAFVPLPPRRGPPA